MRTVWMSLSAVVVVSGGALASAPPVCFDFDGSLPVGATLTRATPRMDTTGAVIGVNTPRWTNDLVAPAVQLITESNYYESIAEVQVVGGVEYTAVIRNLVGVRLTTGWGGCDTVRTDLVPHPTVLAKFGFANAEWGVPKTVEILRSGVVLVHCTEAGPNRNSITVRTTIATFEDPQGWALVRVSDYVPPAGAPQAFPWPGFTRTTHLEHLNVDVSTISEYTSLGLISSVDSDDGRALGYASTDGGLTWTRVIDTNDPNLGGALVEKDKHLHHLEPFEWFDSAAGLWKIGAVGCLGDAEGRAGQIWVHSPSSAFPPEGLNNLMQLSRTRPVGKHALTDIFPIDNSQGVGEALRFIQGNDTEVPGILEARVQNGVEEDIEWFASTIPSTRANPPTYNFQELPQFPYIFQMDRLGSGSIIAGTTEASPTGNPNGFWQSDASSTRWATVRLADVWGFQGIIPTGTNRFWSEAIIGTGHPFTYRWQLWQAGDAVARTPVMLGGASRVGVPVTLFQNLTPPWTVTDVTGQVAGPGELPAGTPVYRLTVTPAASGTVFATGSAAIGPATPDEFVQATWFIRPAQSVVPTAAIQVEMDQTPSIGAVVSSPPLIVDQETNLWTRVAVIEAATPNLASVSMRTRVTLGDADAGRPIDFYVTQPIVSLTNQPMRQHAPVGGVAEDRLTVALPGLGPEWTIAVRSTEAMTFAASLVDGNGSALWVEPVSTSPKYLSSGVDTKLEVRSGAVGSPVVHGATSPQDVYVPTQDLVFFRRTASPNRIEVWCSRGMGHFDTVFANGVGLTPTEIRFGTPDWATAFEGNVHRVMVWPDRALSETEMRRERLTFSGACGDAPAVDVAEPVYPCTPPPPPPCVADITGDGAVNSADFNVLAGNFGAGPGLTWADGDLTGDGYVNSADFNVLAGDFGCGG